MKCEECSKEAEWLVVTPDVEWISRFCSGHLRHISPKSQTYARKD